MVFIGKRKRQLSRRLVAALFPFFLFTLALSAQENEEEVNASISVEISPSKILVGQRFDLSIFADFPSYRSVSIKEPQLPDGLALAGGPYKSAQTVRVGDLTNPQYIKKTRVFYKFKVSEPGIYNIGSFTLSDGETTLSTEPLMFPVLSYDERNLKYPVFARWSDVPQEIYVGETIPLILRMENLEALSFPDSVEMSPPSGGMFERVNSVGEIEVTSIGDDEVYVAPIDSWLYTPTVTGSVRIPKATVSMGEIERNTDAFTVTVLDIPSEIESSGAVGSFQVSTELEDLPLRREGISTLRIRVEGEGNLNYLRMPQPDFSGINVIEKTEVNNFVPSSRGYEGFREDLYRISAGDEAELSILFQPWSWFDRKNDQVEMENLASYRYENQQVSDSESLSTHGDNFSLLNSKSVLEQRDSLYDKSLYYLLVLPGLVSIVAAFVRRRYDLKATAYSLLVLLLISSVIAEAGDPAQRLDKAEELFLSGEHEEALEIYTLMSDELEDNPAYLYNKSLIHYELSQKGEALYNVRRALNIKPGSRLYNNALKMMEEDFGLDHQVRASSGFSPDLFFLIFILLFNGGCLVVSLNIRKRKIELSILIIMIFFLSLMSLGTVVYSHWVSRSDTAVVATPGGDLKKVPGSLGGEWLILQEGTSVQVVSESDSSVLIRTGYGLEGWLEAEQLIFLKEGR